MAILAAWLQAGASGFGRCRSCFVPAIHRPVLPIPARMQRGQRLLRPTRAQAGRLLLRPIQPSMLRPPPRNPWQRTCRLTGSYRWSLPVVGTAVLCALTERQFVGATSSHLRRQENSFPFPPEARSPVVSAPTALSHAGVLASHAVQKQRGAAVWAVWFRLAAQTIDFALLAVCSATCRQDGTPWLVLVKRTPSACAVGAIRRWSMRFRSWAPLLE